MLHTVGNHKTCQEQSAGVPGVDESPWALGLQENIVKDANSDQEDY